MENYFSFESLTDSERKEMELTNSPTIQEIRNIEINTNPLPHQDQPQPLIPKPIYLKANHKPIPQIPTPSHLNISSDTSFRINAKRFFLTFSQSKIEKENMINYIKSFDCQYCLAQEKHGDGGLHYHVYLEFLVKKNIKNPRFFDYNGEHPNIQIARSKRKVLQYILKEDKDYSSNMPKEELIRKDYSERAESNSILLTEDPLKLLKTGMITAFSLKRLVETQALYKQLTVVKHDDLEIPVLTPWGFSWSPDIDLKRHHLWIYSHKPSYGKTTWALNLSERFRCYFWNYLEKFQYLDADTEILFMDEFKKEQRLSFAQLNSICDGTFIFPRKGLIGFPIPDLNVVVLSNFSPTEVYDGIDCATLVSRFEIRCLDNLSPFIV